MLKKTAVALVAGLIGTQAFAQENKFYLGVAGGQTKYDTGVTAITSSLDEKDTGWKVFGGYEINEYVSVEGYYADLGDATLSGSNGQTFKFKGTTYQFTTTASIGINATAWGAALLAGVPINQTIKPYAKLGFNRVTVETSYTGTTAPNEKSTETDPVFGIGVEFNITKQLALRAEYEIYDDSDGDAKYANIGMKFRF